MMRASGLRRATEVAILGTNDNANANANDNAKRRTPHYPVPSLRQNKYWATVARVDNVYGDLTFKHILLPMWVSAYLFKGKTYRFVVNGQTGEVEGESPKSGWKIFFLVAGILLLLLLLVVFGGR